MKTRLLLCAMRGGGFAYVGAMHDSFPHALTLSKKDGMPLL
nr:MULTISPECIES: hypothetical protein [Fibrobacter]